MIRKGLLRAHSHRERQSYKLTGVGRTGRLNPTAALKRVKRPAPEAAQGR